MPSYLFLQQICGLRRTDSIIYYREKGAQSLSVSTQPTDSQNANSGLLTTNFSVCYPVIIPQTVIRFQMNHVSHRNVTTMCYQVLIGLKAHIPYWSYPHSCLVLSPLMPPHIFAMYLTLLPFYIILCNSLIHSFLLHSISTRERNISDFAHLEFPMEFLTPLKFSKNIC